MRPNGQCGACTPRTALLVGVLTVAALALSAASCTAAAADGRRRQADAPPATFARRAVAPNAGVGQSVPVPTPARGVAGNSSRAPRSPPLAVAPAPAEGEEAATNRGGPPPEADPLVTNGLSSPLCRGAPGGAQLSGGGRRNCETSGFVAAADPTGDYGVDVHIDTGVLGLSKGGLLSTVQALFVTPLWTAVVWAMHALVVMLEWCFTVDLLDSASVSAGLGRSLRQAQATFTEPWLATVLAIGSVLAAYNGLIRRRVAETVGQALLTLAMMAAGIWVTLDPVGTVGALGGWANQASLSTLAVSASGTPARAGQALADSMGQVFATAVEVPWCYLEFGDVGWCRNPARLDPRLRADALSIAAGELTIARCRQNSAALRLCAPPGSVQVQGLEHSAQLLRQARSNGAIFLALPANGSQRNSINDRSSLLWAICQSDNATACRGPTAAQAEFRTNRGTWSRVAGLLLIVAGVLGLLLLLGFLALRLLTSALFSLLYLMLAPAAVLTPALGDGGRAIFRRWAAQLLAALVAKLVFSFVLGAILAVLGMLSNLEALGWWTQWLLMSAFWWAAFIHRRQALQAVGATLAPHESQPRTLVRRASDAFDTPRRMVGGARAAKRRHDERRERRRLIQALEGESGPAAPPSPTRARQRSAAEKSAGADRAMAPARTQASRTLQAEHRGALAHVQGAAEIDDRLAAMRAQLARVNEQRERAAEAGDSRRSLRLADRAARIGRDVEHEQGQLTAARRIVDDAQRGRGDVGAERADARERFLDAQTALPPSAARRRRTGEERRDYPALAGLAGYDPCEYDVLDAREKRSARLQIDRELASRSEARVGRGSWVGAAREATVGASAPAVGRVPAAATGAGRRAAEGGSGGRGSTEAPARARAWSRIGRGGVAGRHDSPSPSESSVMDDAREVAARRKRQLGRGRP
jgi:hypothetical protein